MKFRFTRETLIRETKEWGIALFWALILTLIVRAFLVQAFKIPSGSMRPTLLEGDKLFVNKLVYRLRPPQRGEIVVFKFPQDRKKDFIKRLVAFEGETVEIREGKIFVEGKLLDDSETFGRFTYYNHEPYGSPGSPVRVPADCYYVLGDNSANSTDSRFWGFVPEKNLIGKASFRWWPLKRIGSIE